MFDPQEIKMAAFAYYPPLGKVKRYVDQSSEAVSLGAAARIAGLEEKYFSTFFRAKTGVRFKDWSTYVRLTRAMDMLRAEDHSITRVAFAAGFDDLRTFERSFKRLIGMTPRAFKRSVRP